MESSKLVLSCLSEASAYRAAARAASRLVFRPKFLRLALRAGASADGADRQHLLDLGTPGLAAPGPGTPAAQAFEEAVRAWARGRDDEEYIRLVVSRDPIGGLAQRVRGVAVNAGESIDGSSIETARRWLSVRADAVTAAAPTKLILPVVA